MSGIGISDTEITKLLAGLRAWGEIQGVPQPQLDAILDNVIKELRGPQNQPPVFPPVPPPPPPPPPP